MACSCDWGCPCTFDAPPTFGHCDGAYVWAIKDGRFEKTRLDGITVVQFTHFPEAIHKGHGLGLWVVDEKANAEQRKALDTLMAGGGIGLPFDIWAKVVERWLPTVYAPIQVKMDGLHSTTKIAGGSIYDLAIAPIKNPVTGDVEALQVVKGTGFTSKTVDVGMALKAKFGVEGFSYDATGKHAEFAPFHYKG